MENDNKDENHVDDQENNNTHRQSATHSFALWPFPRHLEHLSFSAHALGWP
jgi:hypothetical protein